MTTATEPTNDAQLMESVLVGGDLSKLNPAQRVTYYHKVCESMGLNPLTKPFDYIQLNGRLTLYAKKDATDQLRRIHSISITDVNIVETDKQFIVKVKGQDREGRLDVEVGVVNKSDMRGDTANAQMKAVTKAKRRLTLSLCGLGWLDETEIQTIPDARPVAVDDNTGEIIEPESINQDTGQPEQAIEILNPLSDKAVNFAAGYWNVSNSNAAKDIAKLNLGNRISWTEFVQIVETGRPK